MVLGIPDDNIVYELNVNTSDFPYLIEEGLKPKMNNNIPNKEIFVYYAGHGDLYKSFDERDEKDITKSYLFQINLETPIEIGCLRMNFIRSYLKLKELLIYMCL